MFTFIIVLIALIALLMTLVILLQSGKGGGLAGIASGGATQQVLGSRQAPDLLEKATWVLGAAFIFLCIASNFFITRDTVQDSVFERDASESQQQAPPPALPGGEGSGDGGAEPLPPAGGGQGGGN